MIVYGREWPLKLNMALCEESDAFVRDIDKPAGLWIEGSDAPYCLLLYSYNKADAKIIEMLDFDDIAPCKFSALLSTEEIDYLNSMMYMWA